MLIKFETKSSRVKGLAFHPKRKWVLASLHNGIIQLWNYDEKTIIDKFEHGKAPVRGIDFHRHQALFVSGGDDNKIKLWNYKSRRCIYTWDAHEDYVRTVTFHHEHPWILSSSDDQSIRIWNWQSRSRIAVLTGHTHYIMCAQFHPSAEFILSASIDQTLRLWDITALKIKNTTSSKTSKDENSTGLPEILTKTDYTVESKDAHMAEINWCSFHPSKDIAVSAAEDNYIKVWRVDPRLGLTELYTLRGHYNSVNCAIFHPRKDLILSASEDKSIRIWDLEKMIPLFTHRKDVDRFWTIAAHPKENLFAAGHDTGLMIFKTERERPAFTVVKDVILFIKNNSIYRYNMKTSDSRHLARLKPKAEIAHYYHKISCYSYDDNSANQILVTVRSITSAELSVYDLYKVPRSNYGDSDPVRGKGMNALFIGANRYAVVDPSSTVVFKVNGEVKKGKSVIQAREIFEAGPGRLFLKTKTKEAETVSLYDVEKGSAISTIKLDVKQVVMSDNKNYVALVGSNRITICDGHLNILSTVTEQRKIKSVAWNDGGVLFYTTPVHVKYALTDGHSTTIRSVQQTLYIMAIKNDKIFCIERNGDIKLIPVDPREFQFKQAVIKNDRGGILSALKQLTLTRAEISFLVKKGYPGLALKRVEDAETRFPLALQAFDIDDALESAKKINNKHSWQQLAEVAMQVGHVKAAEQAYINLKKPYKLAMLYLVSGQKTKMIDARRLAKQLGDTSTEFIISLMIKDFAECTQIIRRCGHPNLAYSCAVNHGLYELAEEISEELSEEQLMHLPSLEKARVNSSWMQSTIPDIQEDQFSNWPLLNDELETIEAVLDDEPDDIEVEEAGDWDEGEETKHSSDDGDDDEPEELVDAQEDGWDDEDALEDLDDDEDDEGDIKMSESRDQPSLPNLGQSIKSKWSQISDLALHHVLAGSYTSAFGLLQNQVGAVNPEPLKDIFKDLFMQSRAAHQSLATYSTVYTYPTSNGDVALPTGGYDMESLQKRLAESYKLFSQAKLPDAIDSFRNLLLSILFFQVNSRENSREVIDEQIAKAKEIIAICREYIMGVQVWLEKKNITGQELDDHRRACELAAYFAKLNMSKYRPIVLKQAFGVFRTKPKDFQKTRAASSVARRLVDYLSPSDPKKAELTEKAEKMRSSFDAQVDQRLQLDYDDLNPYSLCAATFKPIYSGYPLTECPLCDAKYKPEFSGQTCKVCLLSEIGKHCSKIRFEATDYDN